MADNAQAILLLDEKDRAILRVMENKFRKDFGLFYEIIQPLFIDKDGTDFLNTAQERITKILQRLADLENPLETPTLQARKFLIEEIGFAGLELKAVDSHLQTDFAEGLRKQLDSHNLNPKFLMQSLNLFKGKLSQVGKPPTKWQKFQEAAPTISSAMSLAKKPLGSLGGSILRSLPLGSIAQKGAGMLKEHLAEQKAKKQAKEDTRLAAAGEVASSGLRKDSAASIQDELSRHGGYDEEEGAKAGRKRAKGGLSGAKGLGGDGVGLMEFFNKGAFQAKWTKKIFEALVDGKTSEGPSTAKEKGSGLWDIIKSAIGTWFANLASKFLPGLMQGLSKFATSAFQGVAKTLMSPIAQVAAGVTMGAFSAVNAVKKAGEWFGKKPGEKVSTGEKVAAGVGGFLGGTGPGLGEKGSSIGGVLKNTLYTAIQGGLMGSWAGLPGIIIGAIVGTLTGLIGGKRIAQGIKTAWDATGNLWNSLFGGKDKDKKVAAVAANGQGPQKSDKVSVGDQGPQKLDKVAFTKTIQAVNAKPDEFGPTDPATGIPLDKSKYEAYRQKELLRINGVSPQTKPAQSNSSAVTPPATNPSMSVSTKAIPGGSVKETETVSGGQETIVKSGDVKAIPWDQRTEAQKRVSIRQKTSHNHLEGQDFTASQRDRELYKTAGIKLKEGQDTPAMNELSPDQQLLVRRTQDRHNQERMLRENVASEARAKLDAGVPVDTVNSDMQRETVEGLAKIDQTMKDMAEQSKKAGSSTTTANKSGYDAWNTRNPQLSAMNQGALDNQ